MNKIKKVNFYNNELTVIEKEGLPFVAMKPIVEALGLKWNGQLKLIKDDPVLSKGMHVTSIPSNGGNQDTVCLPLEYLNGWLFKVPAKRYKGKRQKNIIKYQEECYRTLYEYWHHGGIVNPRADENQLDNILSMVANLATKVQKLSSISERLEQDNCYLRNFQPKGNIGEISGVTGRPKDKYVRGYFTSNKNANPVANLTIQLQLPFGECLGECAHG